MKMGGHPAGEPLPMLPAAQPAPWPAHLGRNGTHCCRLAVRDEHLQAMGRAVKAGLALPLQLHNAVQLSLPLALSLLPSTPHQPLTWRSTTRWLDRLVGMPSREQ